MIRGFARYGHWSGTPNGQHTAGEQRGAGRLDNRSPSSPACGDPAGEAFLDDVERPLRDSTTGRLTQDPRGAGARRRGLCYTGRQALEDNPFRSWSRPYLIVGALVERHVGQARLFVNFENLTNVRQTRWDPLVLPACGRGGRWTTGVRATADHARRSAISPRMQAR
jgi:hypothetical protein